MGGSEWAHDNDVILVEVNAKVVSGTNHPVPPTLLLDLLDVYWKAGVGH